MHIRDVVAGHLAALEYGRCGQRYILSGENMTVVEMVKLISAVTNTPVPLLVLPGSVARRLVFPLRLVQSFLDLPVSYSTFHVAGYHFYYDNIRAQVELRMDPPLPAETAIQEPYDWFLPSKSGRSRINKIALPLLACSLDRLCQNPLVPLAPNFAHHPVQRHLIVRQTVTPGFDPDIIHNQLAQVFQCRALAQRR